MKSSYATGCCSQRPASFHALQLPLLPPASNYLLVGKYCVPHWHRELDAPAAAVMKAARAQTLAPDGYRAFTFSSRVPPLFYTSEALQGFGVPSDGLPSWRGLASLTTLIFIVIEIPMLFKQVRCAPARLRLVRGHGSEHAEQVMVEKHGALIPPVAVHRRGDYVKD